MAQFRVTEADVIATAVEMVPGQVKGCFVGNGWPHLGGTNELMTQIHDV
jgi:hypothetical protein